MSLDGVQSFRKLVTEYEDFFRLKLGTDPPANVKPLVIKLRDCAEPVCFLFSSQVCSAAIEVHA
jgi:hypothetical protein